MRKTADRVTATIEALRARAPQLQADLLVRIYGISDPTTVAEQEYVVGLRASVAVGVDYGIDTVEAAASGTERPVIPAQLLVQARLAARNEVSLDTVLRRYTSGNAVITGALLEESERARMSRSELKVMLHALAVGLDRMMVRVSEEYSREREERPRGSAERRAELINRLLAGEVVDDGELAYPFEGWHLGFVCAASEPCGLAREFGRILNRNLLMSSPRPDLCWGWLGGKSCFDEEQMEPLLDVASTMAGSGSFAFGEPGHGMSGWRLSHRQAASALPVARRSPQRVARYSEVSLLASALQDELLASSLRQIFLEPLGADRDEGKTAKRTLRAYFEASGNVTSAAAALGVNRRTVANRLAAIEQRVGRPLSRFAAEIETAIRLEELDCS